MAEPSRVEDCVAAIRAAVSLPVTVKCRNGIDDQDEEGPLDRFIENIADAGCSTVVHARKAWLKALSPRENREIPPLNYERVYRLKRHHLRLAVVLNGGIRSLADALAHLILAEIDPLFYGQHEDARTRAEVAAAFLPYVEAEVLRGTPLHRITRHMLGLFAARRPAVSAHPLAGSAPT